MRLGPQSCVNTAELHFGPGSKLTVLGKGAQLGVRECVMGRDGKRGQRPSSVLGCAQRRAAPGPGTPGSGRGRSDGASRVAGGLAESGAAAEFLSRASVL